MEFTRRQRSVSGGCEFDLTEHIDHIARDLSWLRDFNWSHDVGIAYLSLYDLSERLTAGLEFEPSAAKALRHLQALIDRMERSRRTLDPGDADPIPEHTIRAQEHERRRFLRQLAAVRDACVELPLDSALRRPLPFEEYPPSRPEMNASAALSGIDWIMERIPEVLLASSIGREELGDAYERIKARAERGESANSLMLNAARAVIVAIWNTQRERIARFLKRLPSDRS